MKSATIIIVALVFISAQQAHAQRAKDDVQQQVQTLQRQVQKLENMVRALTERVQTLEQINTAARLQTTETDLAVLKGVIEVNGGQVTIDAPAGILLQGLSVTMEAANTFVKGNLEAEHVSAKSIAPAAGNVW